MRSARKIGSLARPGLDEDTADGSSSSCCWMAEMGSIDNPRIAVTSCWMSGPTEEKEENLFCAADEVGPEYVPLRRNMADGFSFESLDTGQRYQDSRHEDVHSHS